MGAERRWDRVARVDTGERIPPISMAGLQRSAFPLRARPRFADASAAGEELYRVDLDVSLEANLRLRVSVRRPAVHAPALPSVAGLSRHSGCLHAQKGNRLLREQPPRHVCES